MMANMTVEIAPLLEQHCHSLPQTQAMGQAIAEHLPVPACVYLEGNMGAGKTTLCQAIIAALGYAGSVTSPTYNLIHEYELAQGMVYHMDLYRLQEPSELEFLALADLCNERSVLLIEWPERGGAWLPAPSHIIRIEQAPQSESRHIGLLALSS